MSRWEIIDRVVHDTSGIFSQGDVTDRPCPAVTVGAGGMNACHYQIHYHTADAPPVSR